MRESMRGPVGGERLAAWPPVNIPLASRLFVERRDEGDSALDRWASGWWLSRPSPKRQAMRRQQRFVAQVVALGETLHGLSQTELLAQARAAAERAFVTGQAQAGVRALALVREAARRTLGLLAYPPQVYGAWMLVSGHLIELDTGEGKTLTAAIAACVGALAGVPTHVITVNDYLAQRDAQKMSALFGYLGLRVGVVHSGVAQALRHVEYAQDLTYCTNKDVVFDYLRDRVNARGVHSRAQLTVRRLHGQVHSQEPLRLRGLHFAIVDEADSILIDEARTPLILSAAREAGEETRAYEHLLRVAASMQAPLHYRLVEPHRQPELKDEGRALLEDLAREMDARDEHDGDTGPDALMGFWRVAWVREHYIVQALRALHVFKRDQHYVVHEGKIVIVDEFTGRLLPDRSWEQGLHQLVEVKEGCKISGQNRTLARLTYQTFFARYLRLSGMSGTLREVSRETAGVFKVRTVRIEPNRPSRRVTLPPRLLPDQPTKHQAIVDDVRERLAVGQSVLVGTRSVRASEDISTALTAAGVPHQVLNARQNADEAELVARAGQPGMVTVATNMAGRGTDIPVAPEVLARGGLHVVLTEWHESARIDRQLVGRGARQGEPGSCRTIVALDDEVIDKHGGTTLKMLQARYGGGPWPEHAMAWLQKAAQGAAESHNAAQRRHTLKADHHMRRQLAFSGATE